MFSNFTNLYIILVILIKKNIIAKRVKFAVIKFIKILNPRFLFYLLTNIISI